MRTTEPVQNTESRQFGREVIAIDLATISIIKTIICSGDHSNCADELFQTVSSTELQPKI